MAYSQFKAPFGRTSFIEFVWMGKLLPLLKFFHDTDYAYNKYSKGTRVMTIRRLYSLNNRQIINEEIKDTNN